VSFENADFGGHFNLEVLEVILFTREYTQCTAGYTFCFVVVVGGGMVVYGGAGATFNQTWQFQLTVDET
jgi:hypothetical protein